MEDYKQYRKIVTILFSILVMTALIINIVHAFAPNSMLRLIKEVNWDKNNSKMYLSTGMDEFLDNVAPEGNIILQFRGFSNFTDDTTFDTTLVLYMRSVYKLYPRKVFTVPKNVIVNTGNAIQNNPLNVSKKWLITHDIRKIITITRSPQGKIFEKVESIPHKLERKKKRKIQ